MSFRTVMRNPEIPAKAGTRKRHFTGPRIEVRGDTVSIGSREACRSISCCDAVSRLCAGPWAAKMSTPGIGQDGADGENTA